MKIRILALALLMVFKSLTYANIGALKIQASFGLNLLLDDLWEDSELKSEEKKNGTAFELKCLYSISDRASVGFLTGYINVSSAVFSTEFFSTEIIAQDIPVFLTFQGNSGRSYVLAGIGLHFWNGDKGGIDKGIVLGGGYELPINSWLNFDLGTRFHLVFSDTILKMMTFSVGVTYIL